MMPADPVLTRLLDDVARAKDALLAYLTRGRVEAGMVSLKVASAAWNITDSAALMRLRRDPKLGMKKGGRWFVWCWAL